MSSELYVLLLLFSSSSRSLQELFDEVQKESNAFGTLRDEVNLMLQVMDMRRAFDEERSAAAGQKWKLPTSGQPVCLFGAPSAAFLTTPGDDSNDMPIDRRVVMRPSDDSKNTIIFGPLPLRGELREPKSMSKAHTYIFYVSRDNLVKGILYYSTYRI
jgi:hypothetical protein